MDITVTTLLKVLSALSSKCAVRVHNFMSHASMEAWLSYTQKKEFKTCIDSSPKEDHEKSPRAQGQFHRPHSEPPPEPTPEPAPEPALEPAPEPEFYFKFSCV